MTNEEADAAETYYRAYAAHKQAAIVLELAKAQEYSTASDFAEAERVLTRVAEARA